MVSINTVRLRCSIGWLGFSLPILVVILLWAFPQSISATYYTYEAGPVFMLIMGAACSLLFSYKGYDLHDDIINSLAGLFGLLLCLFPTKTESLEYVGSFQIPVNISNIIHTISAILFFVLLSYNSLFLFTKHGNTPMTNNKKKRNIIYRVCGIGMLISFSLFLLPDFYIRTWFIEAVALFFFGISFLTKANYYSWLFADSRT